MDWSTSVGVPLHHCPDCNFKTASLRKLGRHRSVNHAGVKYKCEHCDFVTGYQSNYYRHRKQVHSGAQSVFSCSKCDFCASSNEGLTVHMSQMHKEQYSCGDCAVNLNTKSQWQEHNRTYHGRGSQEEKEALQALQVASSAKIAELMTAAFLPFMQAVLPAVNFLGQSSVPDGSSKSPSPSPDLEEKISNATTPSPSIAKYTRNYVCSYLCGFGTRESRDYLHHLRDAHGEKIPIFYCDKCSYASKFLAKVKRHQSLIHHRFGGVATSAEEKAEEKESKAALCEQTGINWPETNPKLEDGPKENVPEGNNLHEKLKCDLCPYRTEDSNRYKKHIRCHQTSAETKCKFCDFETVYSWNLDRHVRCHAVPGRYTCMRCSFSQNTRQSMSFHLMHHHQVMTVDAECQTESDCGEFGEVSVGFEPYIWEKHAVRFNSEFHQNAQAVPAREERPVCTDNKRKQDSRPTEEGEERPLTASSEKKSRNGMKRYLSEQEAIESPSEEKELKDFEKDPDIQTRTCSICGYQGKWISEMIRHKRVHTNERPFRCKYCSRTSKWKADLIRHVAKVHGIRVVSKYSRSKTFDSDPGVMRALKEAHGFVDPDVFGGQIGSDTQTEDNGMSCCTENGSPPTDFQQQLSDSVDEDEQECTGCSWETYLLSGPSEEGETIYWCRVCSYETRDIHLFKAHTLKHENKRPFRCSGCGYRSNWSSDVYKHIRMKKCGAGSASVVRKNPLPHQSRRKSMVVASWRCLKCLYEAESEENVVVHLRQKHELWRFACALCKFNSSDRKIVAFHLQFQHQKPELNIVDNVICGEVKCDNQMMAVGSDISDLARRGPSETETTVFGGILKKANVEKKCSLSGSSGTSVSSLSFPDSPTITSESPDLEKAICLEEFRCKLCPFRGCSDSALVCHMKGHKEPKGLLNYKCVFCEWYGRKKQSILEHMAVHTSQPSNYMAEVEKNLITPLSRTVVSAHGFTNGSEVHLDAGDMKDVISDFSAILDAAGEGLPAKESSGNVQQEFEEKVENLIMEDGGFTVNIREKDGKEEDDSDFEPEIEDKEAYIHAGEDVLCQGLEFVRQAPKEIQKVSVFCEGESRKMWKCRYCEHVSKRRANVRSHEKKHFKKNPVGLLRCPRCSYRGDKRSLNAHFRVHSGANMPDRYPCSKCPANFRSHIDLVTHMKFHGSENEFPCSFCDYAVPLESNLDDHRIVHMSQDLEEQKNSVTVQHEDRVVEEVDYCPKRRELSVHRKQIKPKRHCCPAENCLAKFADTTQLSRHVNFHSDEKKYGHQCSFCNYSVPYAINLIKHLRAHHEIPVGQVAELSKKIRSGSEEKEEEILSEEESDVEMTREENFAQVLPEPGSLKVKILLGSSKN